MCHVVRIQILGAQTCKPTRGAQFGKHTKFLRFSFLIVSNGQGEEWNDVINLWTILQDQCHAIGSPTDWKVSTVGWNPNCFSGCPLPGDLKHQHMEGIAKGEESSHN